MTPLSAEDQHIFRKGVGILLYLAPERPDIMYVLKKLSTKLASPTGSDMEKLRHVGKYFKGTPDVGLIHKRSYQGRSILKEKGKFQSNGYGARNPYEQESVLDRESRQSVSCGAIMLNGNLFRFQFKRQKCVALSSCEAETIAATSILSEAVF